MLLVVLTHVPEQSVWPPLHAHWLFTQVEPPEQIVPHAPQLALSLAVVAHAPPEQRVWPAPHIVEQALLLQTCVPGQVTPQAPQLLLFDGTHMLLQDSSPVPHLHAPD